MLATCAFKRISTCCLRNSGSSGCGVHRRQPCCHHHQPMPPLTKLSPPTTRPLGDPFVATCISRLHVGHATPTVDAAVPITTGSLAAQWIWWKEEWAEWDGGAWRAMWTSGASGLIRPDGLTSGSNHYRKHIGSTLEQLWQYSLDFGGPLGEQTPLALWIKYYFYLQRDKTYRHYSVEFAVAALLCTRWHQRWDIYLSVRWIKFLYLFLIPTSKPRQGLSLRGQNIVTLSTI
jgi:hypothetical protein